MKRFVMCVVLAAMVMGSICAEKMKIHGIGLSVPIEAQYWWHFDDVLLDETVSTVGINLNYKNMSVHGESWVGFSAIYEMQLGYSFGFISDENFSMLDALNLKWGWGVAFRPTDKIILAARSQENYLIYGGIGCDLKFGVCWVY